MEMANFTSVKETLECEASAWHEKLCNNPSTNRTQGLRCAQGTEAALSPAATLCRGGRPGGLAPGTGGTGPPCSPRPTSAPARNAPNTVETPICPQFLPSIQIRLR